MESIIDDCYNEAEEYSDEFLCFPDSSTNNAPPPELEDILHDFNSWSERHHNSCIITFDEAKRSVWEDGKSEVTDIRNNVIAMASSGYIQQYNSSLSDRIMSEKDCVEVYFGEDSATFAVFKRCLKWDYHTYCKFMITTIRMCSMNASITRLHSARAKTLNRELLMNEAEYTACWSEIDSVGNHNGHMSSANAPKPPCGNYQWMHLMKFPLHYQWQTAQKSRDTQLTMIKRIMSLHPRDSRIPV